MAHTVRKEEYTYEPLSTTQLEIRLIKVVPPSESSERHPQDAICCEISHYKLDNVGFVDGDESILESPHSFRRWLGSVEQERVELAVTQEDREGILRDFQEWNSTFEDALKTSRNTVRERMHGLLRESGLSWEQVAGDRRRAPSYNALSYTWGPEHPLHTIYLNGHEFQVRQNLYDFLSRMQSQGDGNTLFWIDQLCIDQRNISERSQQVQMMGDIYTRAQEVVVWLGPAGENSGLATDFLCRYEALIRAKGGPPAKEMIDAFIARISDNELQAILDVFARPYWSRLWIVQEIHLASKLTLALGAFEHRLSTQIGDEHCYHHLAEAIRQTLDSRDPEFDDSDVYQAMSMLGEYEWSRKYHGTGTYLTLRNVLVFHSLQHCSDPRDKVFGVLNLIDPKKRISVDYNKSTEQVYDELRDPLADEPALAKQLHLLMGLGDLPYKQILKMHRSDLDEMIADL